MISQIAENTKIPIEITPGPETVESVAIAEQQVNAVGMVKSVETIEEQDSYVPEKFEGYVAWGNFNTVRDVDSFNTPIHLGIFAKKNIQKLSAQEGMSTRFSSERMWPAARISQLK